MNNNFKLLSDQFWHRWIKSKLPEFRLNSIDCLAVSQWVFLTHSLSMLSELVAKQGASLAKPVTALVAFKGSEVYVTLIVDNKTGAFDEWLVALAPLPIYKQALVVGDATLFTIDVDFFKNFLVRGNWKYFEACVELATGHRYLLRWLKAWLCQELIWICLLHLIHLYFAWFLVNR